MAPQLCIALLKEVILTFLRAHLPLSQQQKEAIDPTTAREQHPKPKKEQPTNTMEGAQAEIKGSILGASESATDEALTTGTSPSGQ